MCRGEESFADILNRGDDYYSDDEEEAPPMPEIPQQFLSNTTDNIGKPLQLGTSGQKLKNEEGEKSDAKGQPASPVVSQEEEKEEVPEKGSPESSPPSTTNDPRFSFMPNAEQIHRAAVATEVPPMPDPIKQFEEHKDVPYPEESSATEEKEDEEALPEVPAVANVGEANTDVQVDVSKPIELQEDAAREATSPHAVDPPVTSVEVPASVEHDHVSAITNGSEQPDSLGPEVLSPESQLPDSKKVSETLSSKKDEEESDTDFNDFIDEYYADDGDEEAPGQRPETVEHKHSDQTITKDSAEVDTESPSLPAAATDQVHVEKETPLDSERGVIDPSIEDNTDELSMPPPPSVIRRFDQPYGSVRSFAGETDSSASLSTGRRSPDSIRNSRHERNISSSSQPVIGEEHIERDTVHNEPQEEEKEENVSSPAPVQGRWKPLPETTPIVTEDNNRSAAPPDSVEQTPISATGDKQDKLTREILGSFGEGSAERPTKTVEHASSKESVDEQVDPEIMELYQNSSSFLNQSNNSNVDYSERIEPLTTAKSRSPDISEADRETQPKHDDNEEAVVDTPSPPPQHEKEQDNKPEVVSLSDDDYNNNDDHDNNKKTQEAPRASNDDSADDSGITSPTSSRPGSAMSNKDEKDGPQYKSMILPEIPDEPVQPPPKTESPSNISSPRTFSGGSGTGSRNTSNTIAARLNKPPTFDFSGILSKPRSADRKAAFDAARQREVDYDSGLRKWLASASRNSGPGIYTSGAPPAPTENEAKLAAPSRTMSSVIRPAKSMVSSHVINRVGEKSTKKAKGLLARGKKFMKSSDT